MVYDGGACRQESELPSGCLLKSWIPEGDHGDSQWLAMLCTVLLWRAVLLPWSGAGGAWVWLLPWRGQGERGLRVGRLAGCPELLQPRLNVCVPPHHSDVDGALTAMTECVCPPLTIQMSSGAPSAMELGGCDGVMRPEPYEWDCGDDLSELPCPPCVDMAAHPPKSCTSVTPNLPMSVLGLLIL